MSSMPYILHDADIVNSYDLETSLESLKNRINKKGYLENRIQEMFLDNPSRLTFQLVPDKDYDQNSKLNIQRVSGFKIFRKYRKANLVKEFLTSNDVRASFFDHWKSIENIEKNLLNKTKSFCLIHSKEINHPVGSSLNKRVLTALAKADHVIANSKFTKEFAMKLGVKNVAVINPGCNYPIPINDEAKEFAKKIYGNASPKLITISRLDGRKSHHNVMMTVKNLLPKYPSLKYVSIGDGDEGNNLLRLRKTLGLEKSVEFIFKSTEQEKVALLEQSNIFVMPSVIYKKSVEGFGITYIEAASYGKPSIGGIYGGEGAVSYTHLTLPTKRIV